MGQAHGDKGEQDADQDKNRHIRRHNAGGDAPQEEDIEQGGHDVHLYHVGQPEHRQRRSAVLRERTLADLRLRLCHIEGMHAHLAGDDEEHGNGGGNQAPMEQQRAVCRLIVPDGLKGEGQRQAGLRRQRHLAHGQNDQDEGQLVGDHGHHLTAETYPGKGRAGGGRAHDHADADQGEQIEDDHQIGSAGEGGTAVHYGKEQGNGDEGGEAHYRGGKIDRLFRVAGDDGLLAAALEKVIPALEDRGTHAALHPGHPDAVQSGEQLPSFTESRCRPAGQGQWPPHRRGRSHSQCRCASRA